MSFRVGQHVAIRFPWDNETRGGEILPIGSRIHKGTLLSENVFRVRLYKEHAGKGEWLVSARYMADPLHLYLWGNKAYGLAWVAPKPEPSNVIRLDDYRSGQCKASSNCSRGVGSRS